MNAPPTVTSLNALLTAWAVGLAVAALLLGVIWDLWRKKDSGLEAHLLRAGAAGSVPTGLVLMRAGFDPSILAQLSGINIYITFAGFSLVYVSVKALRKIVEERRMELRKANGDATREVEKASRVIVEHPPQG